MSENQNNYDEDVKLDQVTFNTINSAAKTYRSNNKTNFYISLGVGSIAAIISRAKSMSQSAHKGSIFTVFLGAALIAYTPLFYRNEKVYHNAIHLANIKTSIRFNSLLNLKQPEN
mgnify:CR=1